MVTMGKNQNSFGHSYTYFVICLFDFSRGRAQSPFQWVGPLKVLSRSALIFYSETKHEQLVGNGKGRASRQLICHSVNNVCLVPTKWQLNWPSTNIHGELHTDFPCHPTQASSTFQMKVWKAAGTTKATAGFYTMSLGLLRSVSPLLIWLLLVLLSSLTTLVLALYHCSLLIPLFGSSVLIHSPCEISALLQNMTGTSGIWPQILHSIPGKTRDDR